MKHILFSAAALLLPGASHSFLAARPLQAQSRLFQQQYDQGDGQYYGQEGQPQQQYYDANGNPIYTQEQLQQQQYQQQQYEQQQMQQQQQEQQGYGGDEPSLLITDNMQEEMRSATSGVDVGGIDYLALARQRAAERRESNNSMSNDADWLNLAEEKRKQLGDMAEFADTDGWEQSLDDEGSLSDSASLGMGVKLEETEDGVMMTEGGLVVDNVDEEGGGGLLL